MAFAVKDHPLFMLCTLSCLKTQSSARNNQSWVPQYIIFAMFFLYSSPQTSLWLRRGESSWWQSLRRLEISGNCIKSRQHVFSATTSWFNTAIALLTYNIDFTINNWTPSLNSEEKKQLCAFMYVSSLKGPFIHSWDTYRLALTKSELTRSLSLKKHGQL